MSSKETLARVREMQQERQERLLRIRQVLAKTGLGRSSLYALVKSGRFPSPLKLSERSVAWRESAVDLWISERIREHEEAVA